MNDITVTAMLHERDMEIGVLKGKLQECKRAAQTALDAVTADPPYLPAAEQRLRRIIELSD